MAITRKHLEAIAEILAVVKDSDISEYKGYSLLELALVNEEHVKVVANAIADLLADYFDQEMDNFDEDKWFAACSETIEHARD